MTLVTVAGLEPSKAPAPGAVARPGEVAWVANPFLHIGPDRLYNPLTDKTFLDSEPGFAELRRVVGLEATAADLPAERRAELAAAGWLVDAAEDVGRRFLLKYVAIEANTNCNQSCYFCPVSVAPREAYQMPTALYRRILSEVGAYRKTIEAVFMINYNEPTADPRFVELVEIIKENGLPPATLTNGTGLTPKRIDRLVELGGLRFLSINLSTVDAEKYRSDRGGDHLQLVLKNVDYASERDVAEQMDIVVLGTGDDAHKSDFEKIRARYDGSKFNVKYFEVNDRAGYLTIGLRAPKERRRLAGCDYVGSRPLQHLHVTPQGRAILCCQDYNETEVVGDLNTQSVDEVLSGPLLAQQRRYAYGLDEAPERHICRNCRYAITRPA